MKRVYIDFKNQPDPEATESAIRDMMSKFTPPLTPHVCRTIDNQQGVVHWYGGHSRTIVLSDGRKFAGHLVNEHGQPMRWGTWTEVYKAMRKEAKYPGLFE